MRAPHAWTAICRLWISIKKKFSSISFASILTNVAMALLGAYGLVYLCISISQPKWTPEWVSAVTSFAGLLVTALTALVAVFGALWLWRHQQNERSRQLRDVGIAIFEELYHRLLELDVFTDFDRWHAFHKSVYGRAPDPSTARLDHKLAGSRYIESLSNETEMAISNFAVLRDNLGDFDRSQVEAVLRLYTFLCGLPVHLRKQYVRWVNLDVSSENAALSDQAKRQLDLGIGACGYFLHKLDGKKRSVERASVYAAFYKAQKAIHNAEFSQ